MGTLLDSFLSYGATRSQIAVPQATVSGKRESSSVAAVWVILFFRLEMINKNRLFNQNPFHASTNTFLLRKLTFFPAPAEEILAQSWNTMNVGKLIGFQRIEPAPRTLFFVPRNVLWTENSVTKSHLRGNCFLHEGWGIYFKLCCYSM